MKKLFSWDLQVKLTDYLCTKNIAEGRIYDMPPPQPQFPYVVLGEDKVIPWNSKSTQGVEVKLLIHVFSRETGRKQVKQVTQDILDALSGHQFRMDGFKIVRADIDSIQTFRDETTKTCQSLLKLALLAGIEEKAP